MDFLPCRRLAAAERDAFSALDAATLSGCCVCTAGWNLDTWAATDRFQPNRINSMNAMDRERLTKAHQTAQLLLADVREIHAKADSVAMDELMIGVVAQVANISRLLKRLSEQE